MARERFENIIGVFSIGPNPAACLLRKGKLIAMAEEERFVRQKEIELFLPDRAIDYCLDEGGISKADVDCIAYAWDAPLYYWGRILPEKIWRWLRFQRWTDFRKTSTDEHLFRLLIATAEVVYHHPAVIRQRLRIRWRGQRLPPIRFVPHHLAHATCTFFTSGFDRSAIITMDGNGERDGSVLWRGEGLDIQPLETYRLPHSLGHFYTGFTDYLGFRPEYHEGKTMGLSAYGEPDNEISEKLDRILKVDGRRAYAVDPTYFSYGRNNGNAFSNKLICLMGPPRAGVGTTIEKRHKDIAWAVQQRLEQAVLRLVDQVTILSGSKDLCLAGGVALNCAANGRILSEKRVERLFVPPVPNDTGTALGAAMRVSCESGYDPRFKMEHAYWGPAYTDEEICKTMDRMGLVYERHDNIEAVVADELVAGKIVAWFQGRMEIGPRGLGARSLIGDPRKVEVRDRLNRVKGREPWRPLAPAILEEYLTEYFLTPYASPFMAIALKVKQSMIQRIPAVTHLNGTSRPQVVGRNEVGRFRKMICEFMKRTEVPAVVNTSLNVDGEPIVCSVEDAVRSFFGSGIEVLVAGNAMVKK